MAQQHILLEPTPTLPDLDRLYADSMLLRSFGTRQNVSLTEALLPSHGLAPIRSRDEEHAGVPPLIPIEALPLGFQVVKY